MSVNPRAYYEQQVATIPTHSDQVVYEVFSSHVGLPEAIQKDETMAACARAGVRFSDERQLRLVIVRLRKAGVPICASSSDSGYYLAANLAEYQEFRDREYKKKIADMRETMFAMDKAIKAMFPDEYAAYKQAEAAAAGQPALA